MKKGDLTYTFVLLSLLVLTMGAIFLYSNLSFTGMVVGPNGEQCDGNWTGSEWSICADGNQTRTWASTDSINCTSPITEYQSCVVATNSTNSTACTESWTCGDWGTCADGNQIRTCTDSNSCNTTETKPVEIQECTVVCTESWTCGDWGTCADGNQIRTCTDSNSCNTIVSKPAESQGCTVEEVETGENSTEESTVQIPVTAAAIETTESVEVIKTCTPNWECGDWQECIEGTQIKICTDVNNCNSQEGIPETSQSCAVEIKETCFDEIKNQDEAGIDCGGFCEKKCGFLTMVGSVINGPIDLGKKFVFEGMFGSVTKTILSIGVFVFVVGGFIAVKFFLKRKKSSATKSQK